jgi:hypothetical protein
VETWLPSRKTWALAIVPAVSGMVATVGYKSARPERECADASSAVVSQDRVVS